MTFIGYTGLGSEFYTDKHGCKYYVQGNKLFRLIDDEGRQLGCPNNRPTWIIVN